MPSTLYDIIILGGGPAGLTAGIYAARADLKTLILAGDPPGGQLTLTTDVENFPGFPQGITGPELIDNMNKQAERFGCEIKNANAAKISGSHIENFATETNSKDIYTSKTIIISTGASAKWLGLAGEQKLRGKGVSACATCDGFFFKNKVIAVVGAGDAAMEEATFLTRFASKVYVLVRGNKDSMKASKIMQNKAINNPKIEFKYNVSVNEVLGETSVEGLKITNNITNEIYKMSDIKGLFVAIGHSPNTKFLEGFVELDKIGYIKITDYTKTSREGVFVAGDVADYRYRQAITAAGLGCMAFLDAEKFLSSNHNAN